MNKKVYNIILLNILVLGLCSCGDFLEPLSQNEFTPQYVESLNEMLLGSAYPSTDSNNGMSTLLEIINDDVTCRSYVEPSAEVGINPYENSRVIGSSYIYTWQPRYDEKIQNGGFNLDMYTATYTKIMGTNAALDYIEDMVGSEDEKRNVRAQAYALRGYLYFHLVNIYGAPYGSNKEGLGVPLKLTSNFEEEPLSRKTVKEVYDQVVSDLTQAEKEYTVMGETHSWEKDYRLSLPAVQLLLSRVYLYMENWAKAAEYANIVMTQYPQFSLLDLNTLPIPSSTVDYYNFMTYSSPETIWLFGSVKDLTTIANTNLFIIKENSNPMLYVASNELIKTFGTGDLRLDHYIVSEKYKPEEGFKRVFGKYKIQAYSNGWIPDDNSTNFSQALRLSEAYLNYIEASAMLAQEGDSKNMTQAVTALNILRKNRIKAENYTPVSFANAQDMLSFARDERRRELCFEGQRWFDLRRYGMPSFTHKWITKENQEGRIYTLQEKDPWYAIPLPIAILNRNSSLVQNPMGNLGDERSN